MSGASIAVSAGWEQVGHGGERGVLLTDREQRAGHRNDLQLARPRAVRKRGREAVSERRADRLRALGGRFIDLGNERPIEIQIDSQTLVRDFRKTRDLGDREA
jgi:hypothetical protein